jgi:4-hydroxybenzoate polyprenyltransferase
MPDRQLQAVENAGIPASALPQVPVSAPLVLDLDGTLIRGDLLFESFAAALKQNPMMVFLCLWWLVTGGIALVKNRLARFSVPNADLIPVNDLVLAFAEGEAAAGRRIVLATAADRLLAKRIARRFPFISHVLASDGHINLKGKHKSAALVEAYPDGFIYAGDSQADLAIWRSASAAITVETPARLSAKVKALGIPVHAINSQRSFWRIFFKAIRLHQWVKNVLVFAPLALAGRYADPVAWVLAGAAFISMGLIASSTYLVNDLSDIADDRRHWSKCRRPLASGAMPIAVALGIIPLLLVAGFAMAAVVGWQALAVTAVYGAATLSYSFRLKRIPILDTMLIAGMFSLRLLLGVVAIGAVISPWLFVFSVALFLSMALAKRHTEVKRMQKRGETGMAGRGYRADDEPFILSFGTSTAAASAGFLSLYLTSLPNSAAAYGAPQFLWIAPVAITLWLGRIWLLSQRGELDDDPVVFAMRDKVSIALGLSVAMAFVLAAAVKLPLGMG